MARADRLLQKFERTWWYGGDADAYADSLSDPGNGKVFQRHWTGLTPMEANGADRAVRVDDELGGGHAAPRSRSRGWCRAVGAPVGRGLPAP